MKGNLGPWSALCDLCWRPLPVCNVASAWAGTDLPAPPGSHVTGVESVAVPSGRGYVQTCGHSCVSLSVSLPPPACSSLLLLGGGVPGNWPLGWALPQALGDFSGQDGQLEATGDLGGAACPSSGAHVQLLHVLHPRFRPGTWGQEKSLPSCPPGFHISRELGTRKKAGR